MSTTESRSVTPTSFKQAAPKKQKGQLKRIEVEDWFTKNLRTVEAQKQLAHKDMFKDKTGFKENLERMGA